MNPKISIVVVNWNARESLERCLRRIEQVADVPYELIVVDNNSSDQSKQFLKSYTPSSERKFLQKFEVFFNTSNLGCGGGINTGLRHALGDYILEIGCNTLIHEKTMSTLLRIAEQYPYLGILGGKIMNQDGTIQRSVSRQPTVVSQLMTRLVSLGIGSWKPFESSKKFNYNQFSDVEQVKGAFMFFPRSMIMKVGLWDERFFIWFEDTDLCKRVRDAGFKIYYTPEAVVTHQSEGSISKLSLWKRQAIWEQSIFRYFKKHHGLLSAIIVSTLDPVCMIIGMAIGKLKKQRSNIKI